MTLAPTGRSVGGGPVGVDSRREQCFTPFTLTTA